MKKTAKKKTRIESIIDLVDCFIDEKITQDELVNKLLKAVDKPIIELNKEMSYRCVELYDKQTDGKGYFLQYKWWQNDEWIEVTDLTELRVWEYNELVDKLQKHYPDYPIEYLEGRFV